MTPDPIDVDRFRPEPLQSDGQAWRSVGTGGSGELDAGHYQGPETHVMPMWKCPACKAENTGPLEQGCLSCGSGKPGYRVGDAPPPPDPLGPPRPPAAYRDPPIQENLIYHDKVLTGSPAFAAVKADMSSAMALYQAAETWATYNTQATLMDAFVAGYQAARRDGMQQAPPVVEPPPPEFTEAGKGARTIVAALELFRDQILVGKPVEIATGEWCSASEVDDLITAFKERTT